LPVVLPSYLAEGGTDVDRLEVWASILHNSLNTKKKRHLSGGILLSVSLLFGGLAITVLSLKLEDDT
jgi:hypothetical protein